MYMRVVEMDVERRGDELVFRWLREKFSLLPPRKLLKLPTLTRILPRVPVRKNRLVRLSAFRLDQMAHRAQKIV